MSKADYLENAFLDGVLGGPAFTKPATVYVALHSGDPGEAGSANELSGGGYARIAVTNNATNFPAASGGSKSNGVEIAFAAATAGWLAATHFSIWDAISGGNCLYYGLLKGALKNGTVAASTDTVTSTAHGFTNGMRVRYLDHAGQATPGGLTNGTSYFVIAAAANTFQLSLTSVGAAINITTDGGGDFAQDYQTQLNINDVVRFPIGTLTILED